MEQMTRNPELITIPQTNYTLKEMNELAIHIFDRLWEGDVKGSDYNMEQVAVAVSRFAMSRENWEDGRNDLEELGNFIADAFLHEFIDFRKGIFR